MSSFIFFWAVYRWKWHSGEPNTGGQYGGHGETLQGAGVLSRNLWRQTFYIEDILKETLTTIKNDEEKRIKEENGIGLDTHYVKKQEQ